MKKSMLYAFTAALAFLVIQPAAAADVSEKAKTVAETKIAAWLNNPTVIDAVKAQNAANAAMTQENVDELDKKWRAGDEATIKPVLDNALSTYLKDVVAKGEGLYTEIFVMDNKGLNVGQSDKTSDYWQGDEDKWQKTYQVGAGSMHVSEVEQDESTQKFQVQVSLPVVDGEAVIGAVTVGMDVETLEQQ